MQGPAAIFFAARLQQLKRIEHFTCTVGLKHPVGQQEFAAARLRCPYATRVLGLPLFIGVKAFQHRNCGAERAVRIP